MHSCTDSTTVIVMRKSIAVSVVLEIDFWVFRLRLELTSLLSWVRKQNVRTDVYTRKVCSVPCEGDVVHSCFPSFSQIGQREERCGITKFNHRSRSLNVERSGDKSSSATIKKRQRPPPTTKKGEKGMALGALSQCVRKICKQKI